MLDKNALLDSILNDCDIAVHLHGKVPEGGLDYRPTPEQRSTLELLQYLSFCGIGAVRAMAEGSWDGYQEVAERASTMTSDEFPAAMERQKQELRDAFAGISDDDFANQEATLPMGTKTTLGRALLDLPVRWMAAYRMQLFLYAKQAGNEEINTANNWAGVDWKPPAAAAEGSDA